MMMNVGFQGPEAIQVLLWVLRRNSTLESLVLSDIGAKWCVPLFYIELNYFIFYCIKVNTAVT